MKYHKEDSFTFWTWRIGCIFLIILLLALAYNSKNQQETCRQLVKTDVFFKSVECMNVGKGIWLCNDKARQQSLFYYEDNRSEK